MLHLIIRQKTGTELHLLSLLLQNKHQIYIYKTCFEYCVEYTWKPVYSGYFILFYTHQSDLHEMTFIWES